jgi:hypothetical protein
MYASDAFNPAAWPSCTTRCCRTSGAPATTRKFWVNRNGDVHSMGNITASVTIEANDFVAANNIEAFGTVTASQFIPTSATSLKENISPLDEPEARQILSQMNPVKYTLKARPGRQLMGFLAEQSPAAIAVDSKGVDIMACVATLTAAVKAQAGEINAMQDRITALEQRTTP